MVERRLDEVGPDGLLFPSPRGHWPRGSNYRRNTLNPAATAAGWPRTAEGRWAWSFHSLRHVFATWALAQPGARIEDVSRLLGHFPQISPMTPVAFLPSPTRNATEDNEGP